VESSESLQLQSLLWADSVSISSGSGLGLAAQALEVVSFRSVLGLDSRALEILGLAAGALEVVMLWLAKSGNIYRLDGEDDLCCFAGFGVRKGLEGRGQERYLI
jgi:hypothetical protein